MLARIMPPPRPPSKAMAASFASCRAVWYAISTASLRAASARLAASLRASSARLAASLRAASARLAASLRAASSCAAASLRAASACAAAASTCAAACLRAASTCAAASLRAAPTASNASLVESTACFMKAVHIDFSCGGFETGRFVWDGFVAFPVPEHALHVLGHCFLKIIAVSGLLQVYKLPEAAHGKVSESLHSLVVVVAVVVVVVTVVVMVAVVVVAVVVVAVVVVDVHTPHMIGHVVRTNAALSCVNMHWATLNSVPHTFCSLML